MEILEPNQTHQPPTKQKKNPHKNTQNRHRQTHHIRTHKKNMPNCLIVKGPLAIRVHDQSDNINGPLSPDTWARRCSPCNFEGLDLWILDSGDAKAWSIHGLLEFRPLSLRQGIFFCVCAAEAAFFSSLLVCFRKEKTCLVVYCQMHFTEGHVD